jgi:hypothetical protein
MKNPILHIVISCFLVSTGIAQTPTEAYRFSFTEPFGTARNLGTGNSMFAIGPDFSAIALNPSGIAGYWKSEFVTTLGLSGFDYNSTLSGDPSRSGDGGYNTLRLSNLGFIVASRSKAKGWTTSNWAIGINRTADYHQDIQFRGQTLGSMTDAWRENAAGLDSSMLNGFEEGLAWKAGAIYDFDGDFQYQTDYMLNSTYPIYKQENTYIEGGKSELFLGYGATLDDQLSLGFTINLPLVNSTVTREYQEADGADNGIPFFNDLQYTSYVNTTGYGVNAKLGLTVKPSKSFQVAMAVHTPTKMFLTDNFNTTLTYDYSDENHSGPLRAESDLGSFQYAMRTPWTLIGGVGFIAGQSGFISGSIGWTDYGNMRYDYSVRGNGNLYREAERQVNTAIRNTYSSAIDINAGGELVVRQLRLRGGISLNQSAFINDSSFDPTFHAGIGYRGDAFYVDLGYSLRESDEGYLPYKTQDAPQPLAVIETTRHRIAATLGLKF